MKPYEFMRIYHPLLGRFVYKYKVCGIIVDNLFIPVKSVISSVAKKLIKPLAKKAVDSSISYTGDKLGKTVAEKGIEKSGDLIRKRLASKFTTPLKTQVPQISNTEKKNLQICY